MKDLNQLNIDSISSIPKEIKGWNCGAFLLTWVWGLSHHVWVSLLIPLTYFICCSVLLSGHDISISGWESHDLLVLWLFLLVKITITILLGIKGNVWAWQKQHYNSVEGFKKRERSWLITGLMYCFLIIIAMHYAIFV
ncbi:MAG: hypothetical protein NT094_05345, partial [Candidatus Staskawiczbacteria bacterium]|nr:hypothetical protein [Candidatus Staskawiczbacteria bacterium]